jgi:hypothetical protein
VAQSTGDVVWGGERAKSLYVRRVFEEMDEQADIARQEALVPFSTCAIETLTMPFHCCVTCCKDLPLPYRRQICAKPKTSCRPAGLAAALPASISGRPMLGPEALLGVKRKTACGRESGSDAWKACMRRQTQSINYGAGGFPWHEAWPSTCKVAG